MIFSELEKTHDEIVFTDIAVYDPNNDIYYQPFVSKDGRVGYKIGRTDDRPDAETFLYFNPSVNDPSDPADPTVFVYIGVENDPAEDLPQHFYDITNADFGLV